MSYSLINDVPSELCWRYPTGWAGFDKLLGGGFVDGECVLLAGEPGAGKSTLLLQVANNFAAGRDVLYVSGEESMTQIKLRADRLKTLAPKLTLCNDVILEDVEQTVEKLNPKMIIIDSLQMIRSNTKKSDPASPSQMRYCLDKLIALAKKENRILIIIGHSTKTGLIAGMMSVQHMVDAVLFLNKDQVTGLRQVIARKNRFGNIDAPWQIQMTGEGLKDSRSWVAGNKIEFFPFHGWAAILTPTYWGLLMLSAVFGWVFYRIFPIDKHTTV